MPWPLLFFAFVCILLTIPIVGTVVALILAMITLPVIGPIFGLFKPFFELLLRNGVSTGWSAIVFAALLTAPFAVFLLYRCLQRHRSVEQRLSSFNLLSIVVGIPLTLIYAWYILPNKFH